MIRHVNATVPPRTVLLALTEALLVTVCLLLAVGLTFGSPAAVLSYLVDENGAGRIALVVLVFLVTMYYFNLYDTSIITNRRIVGTRLVGVLTTTFIALAVFYYVFPDESLSVSVLWWGILFLAIATPTWRILFFKLNRSARFAEQVLIFGDGPLAAPLMHYITRHPDVGIQLVGYVGHVSPVPGVPSLAPGQLADFLRHHKVTRIIVTMGDRRGSLDVTDLLELKASGVHIEDGPEYFENLTGRIPLASLRLSWLLFAEGFQVKAGLRVYKRMLSLFSGCLLLLVTAPLMLLVALAVRLTSRGPVLVRDRRLGENEVPFLLYRFRVTCHDPSDSGPPRFTSLGRLLHRFRLDKLPELLNVVKGDLSFVGPYPVTPIDEDKGAIEIPYYRERRLVRPGVTGWAQVNRRTNATVEERRESLEYDLFYIKNLSFGLDIYIIIATLKLLLRGR